MVYQLIAGIMAGIGRALVGFKKAEGEEFNKVKFLKTVGVGAVGGLIATLMGIADVNVGIQAATILGFPTLIEDAVKAFYRWQQNR